MRPDFEDGDFWLMPSTVYTSVSGRELSPTPRTWEGPTTDRKINNYIRRLHKWLAKEGEEEARIQGLVIQHYDEKNLSPSDLDSITLSLFGGREC